MKKKVYMNEEPLFIFSCIISVMAWVFIILITFGGILIFLPVLFVAYLFAQSAMISYLKGTGAMVSKEQFPDIDSRVKECAQKIGIKSIPRVYVLHGNGIFNAFATRFLRKNYIILLSDVLDALQDNPDAINFYIGHEMGHIDRKHLLFEPFLAPALTLPLLGAAYSRAREYTCDLYGAICCPPQAAQHALAVLAVGGKRYISMDMKSYLNQTRETSGFWMSFHELIAGYPWLVKRLMRISPNFSKSQIPARNPFAYLLAIFVPRLNLVSLFFIYIFVGIAAGGVLKGNEMIEKAQELERKEQLSERINEYESDYSGAAGERPGSTALPGINGIGPSPQAQPAIDQPPPYP